MPITQSRWDAIVTRIEQLVRERGLTTEAERTDLFRSEWDLFTGPEADIEDANCDRELAVLEADRTAITAAGAAVDARIAVLEMRKGR